MSTPIWTCRECPLSRSLRPAGHGCSLTSLPRIRLATPAGTFCGRPVCTISTSASSRTPDFGNRKHFNFALNSITPRIPGISVYLTHRWLRRTFSINGRRMEAIAGSCSLCGTRSEEPSDEDPRLHHASLRSVRDGRRVDATVQGDPPERRESAGPAPTPGRRSECEECRRRDGTDVGGRRFGKSETPAPIRRGHQGEVETGAHVTYNRRRFSGEPGECSTASLEGRRSVTC